MMHGGKKHKAINNSLAMQDCGQLKTEEPLHGRLILGFLALLIPKGKFNKL